MYSHYALLPAYVYSVHAPNPSVDRTNFKKKNWFSSYVNSMFNAGVFVNPFQDGC